VFHQSLSQDYQILFTLTPLDPPTHSELIGPAFFCSWVWLFFSN